MKKHLYNYKIILIALFILFFSLKTGWAEEEKQIRIIEKNNGYLQYIYRVNKDIELRGVLAESKWYFDVDKELEVIDFRFNLFLRLNELIMKDISYITVYMNNIPVRTMKLKDKDDELIKNWDIQIPDNLINKGYNELKIKTYSRISYSPCDDDENIANWVVVDRKSNYVITYSKEQIYDKISDFPKPFIKKYGDESMGIGVMIPQKYTEDEISAALTLIAHMKEYKQGYNVKTTLFRRGDYQISEFESMIYIGNFNDVPDELRNIIKINTKANKNDGYIYRGELEDSNKPVFAIISDKGKSLINAVKALNNTELKAQMIDRHMLIPWDFNTRIKEEKIDDYIYLKELGLNGIEVKGRNQQVTSIGIKIPFNEVLANEANINLKFRYSDNLDYEKSMVSIYVNGKPVGSKKLERDKRDLDEFKAYIPKELRRNNYYDIRVVFEMIPDGIITCERYLASVPWAYIQEDSSFFVPKKERSLMLLEDLPYPFSKDNDIDITTIVMPDHPTKEDIEIAGKLAELIGIGVKNNEGVIRISKGAYYEEKYKNLNMLKTPENYYSDNLIIFGTPNENSQIKAINNSLWFKYDEGYTKILSNEKIELLPQTSQQSTFVELKPSPYNDEKGLMTITSLNKQSIIDALYYFKDDKRGLLLGDAAIISRNGDLLNFRFQKEAPKPIIEDNPLENKNTRDYIMFAGTVLVFMLIALILYLYKNQKNKK
ncbi:cellulose biosynthesis cyclic di-GMP-binding regulatory protein BcsB [Paramaledivibacter caminithermalis]|uniref:Cellulose synthase subunit n=1 Tax=Paramaledivibacter caminithermalis (strain DSM 15212 / CIP 107654 / DViRD3) TaxID=1121301 RepID=A0A1M6MT59_PARC5|nr:cellulose biosynthesis cyclic di-GMP-binding regulatory protein BcsB [Paramaledivibacter caminithermalis]SHJ86586.1 cellulose synthase subunit [Paramaledivibacter caminithermalis DSM 15212]